MNTKIGGFQRPAKVLYTPLIIVPIVEFWPIFIFPKEGAIDQSILAHPCCEGKQKARPGAVQAFVQTTMGPWGSPGLLLIMKVWSPGAVQVCSLSKCGALVQSTPVAQATVERCGSPGLFLYTSVESWGSTG